MKSRSETEIPFFMLTEDLFGQDSPLELSLFYNSDIYDDSVKERYYKQVVYGLLSDIFPYSFLQQLDVTGSDFKELLPVFKWSSFSAPPCKAKFYLLAKSRVGIFKFFYEMLSRWLVPGKQTLINFCFATDFVFKKDPQNPLVICELSLEIQNEHDFQILMRNLPTIESEILLGAKSGYQAQKILEVRGVSSDVKTAMIQEYIISLLQRRPLDLKRDLLVEMQHFLVTCKKEFKDLRDYKHMGLIITVHYLFKRALIEALLLNSKKRYLHVKVLKTKLYESSGSRSVLSILVGVNFIREHEIFEEKHLLKVIQSCIDDVKSVEGSFFCNIDKQYSVSTLYLEIEKPDGGAFSIDEVRSLKFRLSEDLKDSIEQLTQPVFMPRNEEEVMKNIVMLSQQLKYIKDLPQVIVSFSHQTEEHLTFTVILLRVLKDEKVPSIEDLFKASETGVSFVLDQVKNVGYLRKKYPKQANVFSLSVNKLNFLRADYSVDLYKARQVVVEELERIVGEVRDYNGGLISKQNELMNLLKESLFDIARGYSFLLENFFYSLVPNVMRSLLDLSSLRKMFTMILEVLEGRGQSFNKGFFELCEEEGVLYLSLCTEEESVVELLSDAVVPFFKGVSLAMSHIKYEGKTIVTIFYRTQSIEEKEVFIKVVERIVREAEST